MSEQYTNGQWHDSGLIINPTFPYLGEIFQMEEHHASVVKIYLLK
jgi:hypothetical protein